MATAAATAIYDRNNNHEQPKKRARRNWNAPENKKKLDRIKKAWHKNCREEKKVCFKKFCNDKDISASTLKRHLNGGVTYTGMSGRPFQCDALLKDDSNENELKGKINLSDICSIFKQWQYETDKRLQENGKLRHDYFVTAVIESTSNYKTALFSDIIKNDLQKPTRWIHIAALLGVRSNKHYCYMWLNYEARLIRYHDSSHYDLKRRAAKKEDSATKQKCIIKIVRKWIETISGEKFNFLEETVVENLPRQNNNVDCGVYLLFYADCTRNKLKIKGELSTDEIANYRSRLGSLVKHQSKHGKERWPNNKWLNISAKKVSWYSYKLARQLGTAGANQEKNSLIEASLNEQLEMKQPGRDVLATQAATTSERFSAKQLSECIIRKIEGVCAYALLKMGTQSWFRRIALLT